MLTGITIRVFQIFFKSLIYENKKESKLIFEVQCNKLDLNYYLIQVLFVCCFNLKTFQRGMTKLYMCTDNNIISLKLEN